MRARKISHRHRQPAPYTNCASARTKMQPCGGCRPCHLAARGLHAGGDALRRRRPPAAKPCPQRRQLGRGCTALPRARLSRAHKPPKPPAAKVYPVRGGNRFKAPVSGNVKKKGVPKGTPNEKSIKMLRKNIESLTAVIRFR